MIEDLLRNNLNWAATRARLDPEYFRRLSEQQAPEYLWIGCSDSRVPANEIVGLQPGELFVHRNVANLAPAQDMNLLAVLQFALESLKVRHIIVCGHYGCGGVRAVLDGQRHGILDHWMQRV
ncbi:MAG: carbonic anhydrase, partial [Brevundimonas sp.]|nr:carbonic anhydrase [Brevundimonas sp.]